MAHIQIMESSDLKLLIPAVSSIGLKRGVECNDLYLWDGQCSSTLCDVVHVVRSVMWSMLCVV